MDAEWLEWLKSVKMGQLKESLGVRNALLQFTNVDPAELKAEIEAIKAEIHRRTFPKPPANPWGM